MRVASNKLFRAGFFLGAAIVLGECIYVALGGELLRRLSRAMLPFRPTKSRLHSRTHRQPRHSHDRHFRGDNTGKVWYDAEHAAAKDRGVPIIDVALSSNCPPTTAQFRQLIDLMDNAPQAYSLSLPQRHDRTGLASMMYLLLQTNGALANAQGANLVSLWPQILERSRSTARDTRRVRRVVEKQRRCPFAEQFRTWGQMVYREEDIWRRLGLPLPLPYGKSP